MAIEKLHGESAIIYYKQLRTESATISFLGVHQRCMKEPGSWPDDADFQIWTEAEKRTGHIGP